MNSRHQVVWASVAENDLKGIIEYISVNSFRNALNILRKIKKKTSSLYTLPERGRIVPELQDQGILHTGN
jgi:plasmid stabilization system protein ParE